VVGTAGERSVAVGVLLRSEELGPAGRQATKLGKERYGRITHGRDDGSVMVCGPFFFEGAGFEVGGHERARASQTRKRSPARRR